MMTDTIEPPITACAPGKRTPKDQIKAKQKAADPVTPANGLLKFARDHGLSHQTMLTKRQQKDEAEMQSVVLDQPHWRGLPSPATVAQYDVNYLPSPLGNFCREYHENGSGAPMAYRTSTAFLRYRAGMAYAMVINDARIAEGHKGFQRGDADPLDGPPSNAALQARKEVCRTYMKRAKAIISAVDSHALEYVDTLCLEERPILNSAHALIVVQALYALSLHFGIEKPGYHDGAR